MNSAGRALARFALLAACALPVAAQAPQPREFDFAEFGTTQLRPGGQAGLVVLVADRASRAQTEAIASAFTGAGRSAAIVDLDTYLARVGAAGSDCFDASTLMDVFAQRVQQELRFGRFGAAALVGIGRGATFVQLLLGGSRAGLFAAGIGAGAAAPLALPVPPCGKLRDTIGWQSPETAVAVPAGLQPAAPWAAIPDVVPAHVLNALDGLLARESPADAPADLPLVELPQAQGDRAPWFALVISGDGGWANIDRDIAEDLGARGIPVLGWNSLRYFWEARTPDATSEDLARVVRYYLGAWHKQRVLLIGYSLGADVLPFMISRAPEDVRAAIAGLVLLSPSPTVDFQFHISNWLGSTGDPAPYPLEPEMRRIGDIALLCIFGAEEAGESLCPRLTGRRNARVVQLPGDHHFDGDYGTVTSTILGSFPVAR